MRHDVKADTAPPPSGGLIRLEARAADLGSWLGPTWAALCGVLASNAFDWQSEDWLRLSLLLLLVDAAWGTLWTALASTDWERPMRSWRNWEESREVATLPYTLPGSAGDRTGRWLGKLRSWWREELWPSCGSAVRAILVALPLSALIGILLGPELLLLSGAVLALMQLGVIWEGGRGAVPPGWDALVAVAMPWLAGHATFASATLPSAGLATLFALAWGSSWNTRARSGRTVVAASQLACAASLVILRRPLAAGALFLILVPQMALLPWVRQPLLPERFVRYTRPWLMAGMAVAALVL